MFFHIFKNTLITNKPVACKFRSNFNIDNSISLENCTTIENMMNVIYNKEINEFESPTFIGLDEILVNPIIRDFCYTMGIKYEAYKIMVDFSNFYTYFCIKPYHFEYKDRYIPLSKEDFSESDTKINKWNVGNIPLEFLINHISTNEYVNKIYHMYYSYYKNEAETINDVEQTNLKIDNFADFMNSTKNDLCFTNEFVLPLFNKKLMLYLRDINYRIPGI